MSSVRRQSCSRMVISVGGAGASPVGCRATSRWPQAGLRAPRTLASDRSYRQREPGRPQQGVGNHVLPALHPGRQGTAPPACRHSGRRSARASRPTRRGSAAARRCWMSKQVRVRMARSISGVQECCVDALRLVETPGPRADFRTRAERRPGQELAARWTPPARSRPHRHRRARWPSQKSRDGGAAGSAPCPPEVESFSCGLLSALPATLLN